MEPNVTQSGRLLVSRMGKPGLNRFIECRPPSKLGFPVESGQMRIRQPSCTSLHELCFQEYRIVSGIMALCSDPPEFLFRPGDWLPVRDAAVTFGFHIRSLNESRLPQLCHVYIGVSSTPFVVEGDVNVRLLPPSQVTFPLSSIFTNLNSKVVFFGTLTGRNHFG